MTSAWAEVPLNEVCRPKQWPTITGGDLLDRGFPVYGANGKIGCYSEYNHEDPTILITCRGATCGTINISEPRSYVTGNAMCLDDLDADRCDLKFVYYALVRRGLRDAITGSAQPQITRQSLQKVTLPLPPLPEQKRIAAILDKADAIRKKRKQAIALTEDLLRSTFLEMFGDPVLNPKGWEVVEFGQVIADIQSGWSASGEVRPLKSGEMGVLKVSAVTSGRFRPEEYKAVSRAAINRQVLRPRKGDLLMSRANTRDLVAATCIVEEDHEDIFLPDKLWRVVPQEDKATAEYLRYLLAHGEFRRRLTQSATGTSGSMLNISQNKFRGALLPLPPLGLQQRFAGITRQTARVRRQQISGEMESADLFNALSDRAFRGEA